MHTYMHTYVHTYTHTYTWESIILLMMCSPDIFFDLPLRPGNPQPPAAYSSKLMFSKPKTKRILGHET